MSFLRTHRCVPVRAMGRATFLELLPDPCRAVVCLDELEDAPALQGYLALHRSIFANRDFDTLPFVQRRIYVDRGVHFSDAKARAIKGFVEHVLTLEKLSEIVVVCGPGAGRQRSLAVALALSELYGLETDKTWLRWANPSVYCRLKGVPREKLPKTYFLAQEKKAKCRRWLADLAERLMASLRWTPVNDGRRPGL